MRIAEKEKNIQLKVNIEDFAEEYKARLRRYLLDYHFLKLGLGVNGDSCY